MSQVVRTYSCEVRLKTLTPQQAAKIADGVYQLQDESLETLVRAQTQIGCEGLFAAAASHRITGRSGVVFKPISGFGYLTEGVDAHQGELLCVSRGTASLVDYLSDFNVGLKPGPGSRYVHAGFRDTWDTTAKQIREYLKGRNPSRIHCVGHSLGGALAMLNADYFTTLKIAPVSVYTFGCPRVGTEWFADSLTERVGAANIFRLSHIADPVAMLPMFPFAHAPSGGDEYIVGARTLCPVSFGAHKMKDSYVELLKKERGWEVLRAGPDVMSDTEINEWLHATSNGDRVQMYSAQAFREIGRVLGWLLKQAFTIVGVSATVGFTLLDRIAWLIEQAIKISVRFATYVTAMIRAIMKFLGRAAVTGQELTVEFLRWVLGTLSRTVNGMARAAIRAL